MAERAHNINVVGPFTRKSEFCVLIDYGAARLQCGVAAGWEAAGAGRGSGAAG